MHSGDYEAKITREERLRIIGEARKEIYQDLYDVFKDGDIADVRKTLRHELQVMKEADVAVIHTVGDDHVRCVVENDAIICSVKEGRDWRRLNKNEVSRLHLMQYVDREGNSYGLDCKKMGDTIDCNFVAKEKLEKAEKPFIPQGYNIKWTGPPGFQHMRCDIEDDMLLCKGSSETVVGMQDELVQVKQPDHFNTTTKEWEIGKSITEARPQPMIKGEVPFEEQGSMISLTTKGEKDLDGITFIELSDRRKKKSGRLVAHAMNGKPFMEDEPESKRWVNDEDSGLIGQGYGKNRRKSNYGDIEFLN